MSFRLIAFSFALLSAHLLGACQTMQETTEFVHVSTSFHFEVQAPFSRTVLLFGPESEKGWAGKHWQPRFLHPLPGKDAAGAVFTVPHSSHTSIWVNTIYDVQQGRMQYVAIIPEVVATIVDVKVTSAGEAATRVDVTYTRTALDSAANDDVRNLARRDAASGPEWQKSIDQLLSAPAQ